VSNPWLDIPLEDYEQHMTAPQVQQLEALSDLFSDALTSRRPTSVAVLGVAGGNGLDRIDTARTRRIVGFDIQPEYLEAVRGRFPALAGLELHCADLGRDDLAEKQIAPVELVHAAMILEHAGTDDASLQRCIQNALALMAPDGALSVVLQLPSTLNQDVGLSGVASIELLRDHFTLIAPNHLQAEVERHGMEMVWEKQYPLLGGKAFWMGIFVRTA
jgi:hypothetical protein